MSNAYADRGTPLPRRKPKLPQEHCSACKLLKQESTLRQLQIIETWHNARHTRRDRGADYPGSQPEDWHVRYRYACSEGHEFDGQFFHAETSPRPRWRRAKKS